MAPIRSSSRSRPRRGRCGWRLLLALALGLAAGAQAASIDPARDRAELRALYAARFPGVPFDAYVLGVYAIDARLRAQWEELDAFPPYEFAIEEGRALYEAPLPDGSTLADCLPGGGLGIAHRYPQFDPAEGGVVTLPLLINRCRVQGGAAPWHYDRGPLITLLTYLASTSRGERLEVEVPPEPAARAAYEHGRRLFFSKRGQRNLSCADCHLTAAGLQLREQTLAPVLGAATRYPVYNLRWGAMGSLHARFAGCLEQVGAAAWAPQSARYRALEYFLAVMGSGLPYVAPEIHR